MAFGYFDGAYFDQVIFDYVLAIIEKLSSDTGSGVDIVLNFLASLTKADSGVGVDTILNYLASLVRADVGSGVEHILDRALMLGEIGTGIEAILALLGKTTSDSGICSLENSYLHILEGIKDSHETGSGVDISTLTILHQRSDTGLGTEQVISRALYAKEYPEITCSVPRPVSDLWWRAVKVEISTPLPVS